MKKFVCPVCGYTVEAESLPEGFVCPQCKAPGSKFRVEEGKNPFVLDYKKAPDGTLEEFLLGENRYAQLEKAKPELAKKMRATMAQQYQERFDELTELSK